MVQKNKIIVAALTLCAAAVFLFTLFHSAVYVTSDDTDTGVAPVSTTTPAISSSEQVASWPARIRIPNAGVDAGVDDVGVGKSGNMAVPYTYTEVGWYRYGTLPGNMGSAVIDGHVDNGLGGPAVFAKLSELKTGDSIYIETQEGETLEFKVEEVTSYAVEDVPLEKLFNRADQPRLNLITCEGVWDQSAKMYDRRLVVYAVLVPKNS